MRRRLAAGLVVVGALAAPASVWGHNLFDHPYTGPGAIPVAPNPIFQSDCGDHIQTCDWELLKTFATGNPHTDIDFFEQGGETYLSAGTLGTAPNGGGQTILKLTTNNGGTVDPSYVDMHPSAFCASNPADALGLQHDVEAAPKGKAILNTGNPHAVTQDTQVIVDASDAPGRCHDQGPRFPAEACILAREAPCIPQGGLEIVDVTNPSRPKEIGLTTHIGESHTVNVDPKRPHIAYSVTSDLVTVNEEDGDGVPNGTRENEVRADNDKWDLDGFEVVDMSSCMYFDPGTTLRQKRQQCRPEVYRYRYPNKGMALGHASQSGVYGCHELEIYPNDKLTCGSGNAMIYFDMDEAFRSMGTPNNFKDDKPRGDALPCRVRSSSTANPVYETDAKITDCVFGRPHGGPGGGGGAVSNQRLSVPEWIQIGSPSLEGVRHIASAHHQGRGAGGPASAYDANADIDFDHEAELTASRDFILATDERGGGVTPPGATCEQTNSNPVGNGGIHAYAVDRLDTEYPSRARDAFQAYAREPQPEDGNDKAIFRAPVHTGVEPSLCTAHVFQQIPGQNRIFMGWYSQGTQVVDFIEHPDGTFEWKSAGYFIPAQANHWVSHIFKVEDNGDGTFTYWGATGDFQIQTGAFNDGRDAIDVYKVTMDAPPQTPGG